MDYIYTPGALQALALHYHDTHEDVLAVDAYADFDSALTWLKQESGELYELLWLLMEGHMEVDLAARYHLKARTMARLLDQVFLVLSQYLNDERPIVLPHIEALRDVTPSDPKSDLVVALLAMSTAFCFLSLTTLSTP